MSKLELSQQNHDVVVVDAYESARRVKCERNIVLLYVLNVLMSLHFFGSVMILFFEDWGGISFTQIMVLESIFTGAIFVFEIPTGTIADRFGRKLSLNLAFIVNTVAVLVYVAYPNFYVFAVGEIIWAVAVSLTSGAYEAMVYDTLLELGREKESQKHFSKMRSLGLAGMVSGTIAGGFIASAWGLKSTMTLSAIPLALAFVVGLFLTEPSQHEQARQDSAWVIFKKGVQNIRRRKALWMLIVDSIVLQVIAYYSIWLWQVRLADLSVDVSYFGLVHAGMIMMQIVILNLVEPLEHLCKSKRGMVRVTGVGMGVGFLLFGFKTSVWVVIVGILLSAGFGMSRPVLMRNYMQKHIASEQRATTLSTASMLQKFLLMVFNPIIGLLTEWSLVGVLVGLGVASVAWSLFSPLKDAYFEE